MKMEKYIRKTNYEARTDRLNFFIPAIFISNMAKPLSILPILLGLRSGSVNAPWPFKGLMVIYQEVTPLPTSWGLRV